ncbi:MAG: hypothetical protein GY842_25285 [bacterium]|nr:hypothetical protein [bacterium]
MKMLTLVLIVPFLVLGLSQYETPDLNITRDASKYGGFTFQVGFEQERVMHDRFQIYSIVIAIKHEEHRHLAQEGYVEVWGDKKFIYSCAVPQVTEGSLGLRLKEKVETPNAMLFFFRMNPRYIHESWFNYQVLRSDGSVERNCFIRLKDFIDVVPAKNLGATRDARDEAENEIEHTTLPGGGTDSTD